MGSRHRSRAGLLALLAILVPAAAAAEPDGSLLPRCDGKFGLCRYVDRGTGQELIPARFERAMAFSEGLAAVRIDGRFGYIDQSGKVVIEPRFDLAGEFYQGLAEILVGAQIGVVNRAGQVVVPPRFQRAVPLTKDVVIAVEGAWQRQHYEGFEKLDNLKGFGVPLGNAGLYHIDGHWIRKPGADLRSIAVFEKDGRGIVWATVRGDKFDLAGLMASDGTWVVEPQYEYGAALTDGRAIVRKRIDGVTMSGALDENGKLVVPFRPWFLAYWLNGQALVHDRSGTGKQALMDRNGDLIGGRWFDKVIQRAEEGDIAIAQIDGQEVGLDRAGNIVPHPRNGRVSASCPDGVRVVQIDGKVQITDASGQPTSPQRFDPVVSKPKCDAPFPVRLGGKWDFVAPDGRLLFETPRFDNLYDFSGGYALVKVGAKWGIVDVSGGFSAQPQFDEAGRRHGDLFQVTKDGRQLWVDAVGREQPEPTITPQPYSQALDCGHGMRLVERGDRWGIVDGDGKDVIAPRYRALSCFGSGVAWASIDNRRRWCPIGPDGAVRHKPACREAYYPLVVTHSYPEKFADDPFESSVLWTRAYYEFNDGRRDKPPQWIHGR